MNMEESTKETRRFPLEEKGKVYEEPEWFCGYGKMITINKERTDLEKGKLKMVLFSETTARGFIVIEDKRLDFEKDASKMLKYWKHWFRLSYRIDNFSGDFDVHLPELKLMFGIDCDPNKEMHFSSDKNALENFFVLISHDREKFDCDIFIHHLFIRKGRYVSIPHPGVLWFHNPNMSLYITDEIQSAVKAVIETQEKYELKYSSRKIKK